MLKAANGGLGEVRFLTERDMERIHAQSLDLLRHTGVLISHDRALKNLSDCGACVDFKNQRAFFSAELVERALQTVPRRILLAGRHRSRDVVLEPAGAMHTRNSGGMTQIVDLDSGAVRDAGLADTIDFTRLADALDHIDVAAPLYPSDVPLPILELKTLEAMFLHTDKHISVRALNSGTLPFLVQMAGAVVGGTANLRRQPVISILDSPISPLTFPEVFVEALYLAGKFGIPVEACSTPNIGATGPITLAGSLLLANVEQLAAVIISQLPYPGAPLIWAPRFPAMDMASGITGMLTEGAMVSAAAAQMGVAYYDLVCDFHGPATNALTAGAESVFEECIAAFVTALAGRPAILCGAGALELGMTASFEDLVIADELFGMLNRIVKGIRIDDDTLGVDAIQAVGIGGHYRDHPHTPARLGDERLESSLLKPRTREQWLEQGSPKIVQSAKDRARTILKEHLPRRLALEAGAELREIIGLARQDLGCNVGVDT